MQEPFWPEGLGINRGFLHCLDCADLAKGCAAVRHPLSSSVDSDYSRAQTPTLTPYPSPYP